MDGDRREAGRGKMTSRGQHAGDHEGGELWQGEGTTAESRRDAVHGHKDVCPWKLGRDGQRYTQSPDAERMRKRVRKRGMRYRATIGTEEDSI